MKKSILQKASLAGAMAAGAVLMLGSGTAQADIGSLGNHGIGNGNQVVAPIQAPIDICGNGVAVAGLAGAGCQGGSAASMDLESGQTTEASSQDDGALGDMLSAGNNGIANGNQAQVPIQAPIDVCGNAVGALVGVAGAGCQGGSAASMEGEDKDENSNVSEASSEDDGALGDMTSAGNNGILNGTQLQTPIQVPINVCGNAIAVAGVAGAGCQGGSSASLGDEDNGDRDNDWDNWNSQDVQDQYAASDANQQPAEAAQTGEDEDDGALGDMTSAGNNGILNGTQLQAPVQIPVDVSGNAVGVLGVAGAGSTGGSAADLG